MRYRFFKIPLHGGDAEVELNQFVGGHRVVALDREFVTDGARSVWAVCVTYLDGAEPLPLRKGKIDYREILSEADFAVFAELRALRKRLAEADGVPPYALFTNEQLAAMVKRKIASKSELASLEGVGDARVNKYGEAFLDVLRAAANGAATEHEAQQSHA